MRSIKVTLSRPAADGQFRITALSRGSGGLPSDTDVWNLVMQMLRLKERPEAQAPSGFPYGFPFAFESEK